MNSSEIFRDELSKLPAFYLRKDSNGNYEYRTLIFENVIAAAVNTGIRIANEQKHGDNNV